MKLRVWIATDKVGSNCEEIIEVPDDADEREIEETAQYAAFSMVSWSFEKLP